MMNPDYKGPWLEALRSGRYVQGQGYLSREGRFCCLGVLCEVGVERGDVESRPDEDGSGAAMMQYAREDARADADDAEFAAEWDMADLGSDLLELFGITNDQQTELVQRNDGVGRECLDNPQTFGQIADWIEANL